MSTSSISLATTIAMLALLHSIQTSIYLFDTHDGSSIDFYDCFFVDDLLYCRRPRDSINLTRTHVPLACDGRRAGIKHRFSHLQSNKINISTVLHRWKSSLEQVEAFEHFAHHHFWTWSRVVPVWRRRCVWGVLRISATRRNNAETDHGVASEDEKWKRMASADAWQHHLLRRHRMWFWSVVFGLARNLWWHTELYVWFGWRQLRHLGDECVWCRWVSVCEWHVHPRWILSRWRARLFGLDWWGRTVGAGYTLSREESECRMWWSHLLSKSVALWWWTMY